MAIETSQKKDSFTLLFANSLATVLSRDLGRTLTVERGQMSLRKTDLDTLKYRIVWPGPENTSFTMEVEKNKFTRFAGQGSGLEAEQEAETLAEKLSAWISEACDAICYRVPGQEDERLDVRLVFELPPDDVDSTSLELVDVSGAKLLLAVYCDAAFQPVCKSDLDVALLEEQRERRNLDLVMDVELNLTLRFGQRQMALRDVLALESGSVVELDRKVDEPVELLLDGRLLARGDAVVIDGNYGLRVTEVVHRDINVKRWM